MARRIYASAACNRYPHSLDWQDGLIAYAACNSVCIYNVQCYRIESILLAHADQVNCVRWVDADRLISCSSDKTAIVWRRGDHGQFEVQHRLEHQASVIVADAGLANGGDQLHIVTIASDFTVNVWRNDQLLCSRKHGSNYTFDVKLLLDRTGFFADLNDQLLLFACVGGDELVHLFCYDGTTTTVILKLAGHEDWIRSVDFVVRDQQAFIATASQDNFIRIWSISQQCSTTDNRNLVNEKPFKLANRTFYVKLDTILAGHENWIYAARFVLTRPRLQLISASIDKSIIVWQEPESADDDVWVEVARVGDVGGNHAGFLGIAAPRSATTFRAFAGHSFNGAVQIWSREADVWQPGVGIGGHFDVVNDIGWARSGHYLLSCSSDETTRLHAPWTPQGGPSWHEIARPQVHGYLINCIASIADDSFATGADEKVARVFRCTRSFINSIDHISQTKLNTAAGDSYEFGAEVAALGLSNRAVDTANAKDQSVQEATDLTRPPTEDMLIQSTLWPEKSKLYGHGYEIFAIAASPDGQLLATACKSSKRETSNVLLWSLTSYEQLASLEGHQLTVTALQFSPNGQYLLSVSRDRNWFLWKISTDRELTNSIVCERLAFSTKESTVHARIIWDCSWTADSRYFLTCSRDGKAALWSLPASGQAEPVNESIYELDSSINCCDILHAPQQQPVVAAFGLENGRIVVCQFLAAEGRWLVLHDRQIHHRPVRKVKWQPGHGGRGEPLLASSSDDRTVQIWQYSAAGNSNSLNGQESR